MTTIPATPEQADAWFRCEPHQAQMSGRSCAMRWARAQGGDERGVVVEARKGVGGFSVSMNHCVGCPLGAARHELGAHLRAPHLLQIDAPPAEAAAEEDEMRKRNDLTPADRLVLAWAHGRDWWSRKDVDEGVELGEHAVGRSLRHLQSLGLIEAEGNTVARRYCETLKGAARVAAEGLATPAAPAPPALPAPPASPAPPAPPMPLDPDPPAAPPPAAEVVELQPEVSTEAVPEPFEFTPAQVALDRAEDAYIAARDALQAGAELAVQKLDDGVEVEVIAVAEGLQRLADALQEAFRRLDDARNAVAADRYDALLAQMGVAA